MRKRLSLRIRIFVIVTALVITTAGSCLVCMWYTYQTDMLLSSVIENDFTAVNIAQNLNTSLIMQKGFVTYFFFDGNPSWLDQLEEWKTTFNNWLKEARQSATGKAEQKILTQIKDKYIHYDKLRDKVIKLYKVGERSAGSVLHADIRDQFFGLQDLCTQYKNAHQQKILYILEETQKRSQFINTFTLFAVTGAFIFCILLVYILLKKILEPLQQLISAAARDQSSTLSGDEMKVLSKHIYGLLQDVSHTKNKLQQSYKSLMQSEKLAMVGRLAAGMAHSIRNPLTSVKMRLFSMGRKLELDGLIKDDFEVISHEIEQIESILRNFLEFSRPPKMKMQKLSPSDVVDMALQLLKPRIDAHNIKLKLIRQNQLPPVELDAEQLKEVFINIILNGCEAMGKDGIMTIQETDGVFKQLGPVTMISISDNGPGIPEPIKEKVFQPFYSTKDEGSGLGLSIAARIVEDHGGLIEVDSYEGKGTTFKILLPRGSTKYGKNPDR